MKLFMEISDFTEFDVVTSAVNRLRIISYSVWILLDDFIRINIIFILEIAK